MRRRGADTIAGILLGIVPGIVLHASGAASPAAAQQYEVTDLGTLGGSVSQARGISNDGVVAGEATTGSGVQHAVLWHEDVIADLGTPPGFTTGTAVAVNPSGQVAANGMGDPQTIAAHLWEGGAWTPLGVLPGRHESIAADIDAGGRIVGTSLTLGMSDAAGFIWEAGELSDLGTLGGATWAQGMNDAGDVAGRSEAALPGGELASHAYIWRDGVMTDLGVLAGEDFSQAFDVNEHGDAVGSSWHLTIPQFLAADQATLWRNGESDAIDLGLTPGPPACAGGFPFYTDNVARAINNHGQVVGHAQCVASGGALAAFLWQDGVMHNLNDLIPSGSGWDLLKATGIDDLGRIAGVGLAPGGQLHAFLLTPAVTAQDDPRSGEPGSRVLRLRASPNPVIHAGRVSYTLRAPSRVRLTVHDVSGRTIDTLVDAFQPAGDHTRLWAPEVAGAALPNGIYWLRLEAGGEVGVSKLLVVR